MRHLKSCAYNSYAFRQFHNRPGRQGLAQQCSSSLCYGQEWAMRRLFSMRAAVATVYILCTLRLSHLASKASFTVLDDQGQSEGLR
mmetsp:Transcript_80246/g.214434  ORF Transcript_80246/g.214434 Transcript_80246/m.214434 type:complete len:86 (-) Transcript_80246:1924-2181(-)